MDIQRIRYFLEVVRQKNFTRAAKLCRISQPSLSQQIMKLEGEVGGSLLLRKRGNIELTEHGQIFLQFASAIMAEVQTAEEFIRDSQGKTKKAIRIGAIPTVAPYLIPKVFKLIKTKLPDARLELVEGVTPTLADALRNGHLDFALLSPHSASENGTESLLLLEDPLILTLPKDHSSEKKKKISIAQLNKEKALLLEQTHCLSEQSESYCEAVGIKPQFIMRATQIDTLLGLVEQGMGFTFTPKIAIPHHRHRKVSYHTMAGKPYQREIRLYWMKRHVLSRMHQSVIHSLTT
tara:strand:- start:3923 stop:4798 length:876 start_codon:yes stop_codon:yes gene_type:complete